MQSQQLTNRRVVYTLLAIVLSFIVLYFSFSPSTLISLLNGLLAGAMASIGVTYHRLLWDAWVNPNDFGRVRQMSLTIAGQWVVIILGCTTSIYIRSADMPSTAFATVSFARYLAIWMAIFQVTAPDFGQGVFFGADRKFLGLGIISGLAVAVATILAQGV